MQENALFCALSKIQPISSNYGRWMQENVWLCLLLYLSARDCNRTGAGYGNALYYARTRFEHTQLLIEPVRCGECAYFVLGARFKPSRSNYGR